MLIALMMVFSIFATMADYSYGTDSSSGTEASQEETTGDDSGQEVNANSQEADESDSSGGEEGVSASEADTGSQANETVKAEETDPTTCTEVGDGTESNPYIISNADQMVDLQTQVASGTTFEGKYFELNNDVTLDSSFAGIGTSTSSKTYPFKGIFDGNGNTITVSISGTTYVGVFGYTYGATIENLTVKGSVTGTYYVGAIVGYSSYGTVIRNCVSEATVTGTSKGSGTSGVGGIAGSIAAGTETSIENCVNKGDVIAEFTTLASTVSYGGIVGSIFNKGVDVTITGCENEGDVKNIPAYYVGGIVGYVSSAEVSVEDCTNSGDISNTGTSAGGTGGIVGCLSGTSGSDTSVTRCQNNGNITGLESTSTGAGGIVGKLNSAHSVTQSFNTGDVTSSKGYVGGIVGYMYTASSSIEECYNAGAVSNTATSGTPVVGGILGYQSAKGYIEKCYSYGTVSCTSSSGYVGGVIGRPNSTSSIDTTYVSNNFYLDGTADSGIGKVEDIEDVCESFLESQQNDIIDTLGKAYQKDLTENINYGYPILRWQNSEAKYAVTFSIKDSETGNNIKDASVEISGYSTEDDGSYELSPGTYSYTVSRGGYDTVTDTVTVSKSSKTVSVEMTSTKHEYTITVSPSNATLEITNENETPDIVDPEPAINEAENTATYVYSLADSQAYGAYDYKVSAYTYVEKEGTLEATGSNDETSVTLEKAATSSFTINVMPTNAKVTLTNEEWGEKTTASSSNNGEWKYDLIDGIYTYKVKASGYTTKTGTITIPDDSTLTVDLEEEESWGGYEAENGGYDTDWYTDNMYLKEYEISEPDELAGFAYLVNNNYEDFNGVTIKLTKDINLGSKQWTSIGSSSSSFKGTFDGGGHTISNLTISNISSSGYYGLFGYAQGATIQDIEIENVDISGTLSVTSGTGTSIGGAVGYANNCIISDVSVSGNIEMSSSINVAGIAGLFSGTISDCENTAIIAGVYKVGGIVGTTYANDGSKITRCINKGTIKGTGTGTTSGYSTGGIVGYLCKKMTR